MQQGWGHDQVSMIGWLAMELGDPGPRPRRRDTVLVLTSPLPALIRGILLV